MIAYLESAPLLLALFAAVLGLLGGAGLMHWYHKRQRPGQDNPQTQADTQVLNSRLQAAESRYKQEVASNEANRAFFANMSHELRTPFQGLLGMLDLIGESQLAPLQREHLSTAQRAAHHLLGVLNDILDVSAMDSGMFRLAALPMSLRQVLHDVESLMGREARQKGLVLSVHCAPDVPPWVEGDETRVRQILFNLLSNALKFTREGRISIRLRCSRSQQNGIVLTVQDTGAGMDEVTVKRLFTRFFQADNSRLRRTGGTGLGLEISRNLARMMNGDIHVSSQPGAGTTFTVLMVLPPCEAGQANENPENPTILPELEIDPATHGPLHFLVADDHPVNLQYLSHLLRNMGHEATLCENGQQALALARENDFDALLLDYHMPEMDGLEVTRAVRNSPAPLCRVKIFLLTADVVNDTRQLARDAGVDTFLSKPLKNRDLQRAIAACGLYKARTASAPRQNATPQFMVSDYELPTSLEAAVDEPVQLPEGVSGLALVDWPAVDELVELMGREGVQDQFQAIYKPGDGALAECLAVIQEGGVAQQRSALHKLKGSLMLLGLPAMARYCADGEAQLKANPAHPLGVRWSQPFGRLAQRTQAELAGKFKLPPL